MSKNPIAVPDQTSHFFLNSKNKTTFYSDKIVENGWCVFNKGLKKWEKVPSMVLVLTDIQELSKDTTIQMFSSTEEQVEYDIVSVTTRNVETLKEDFRKPALSLGDFAYIIELFQKHSSGKLLGFIPNETNYYVLFNYQLNKWTWAKTTKNEILTVYTTDLDTVESVIKELNTPLYTGIKGFTNG